MKPFLKWAGGKRRLLPVILDRLPPQLDGAAGFTYLDPFAGGGSVLFAMLERRLASRAIVCDINPDLIAVYRAVRDRCGELIAALHDIAGRYAALKSPESKQAMYLETRARYNARTLSPLERAAVFVFLNKTCFNGLHRVNAKGEFNVPWGKAQNPLIFAPESLQTASGLLQGSDILCGDFEATQLIEEPAFVYLDPPYRPIKSTSSFTAYAQQPFGDAEQIRLKRYIDRLTAAGCYVMLSNSDAGDGFFDDLYSGYTIERVQAPRCINARGSGRGAVTELLIRNY